MEQRPLRLGDILDDYCPRERRVTNHAIVAMIDEDVRQTRCTTCDAEHVYKGGKAPKRRKKETPSALYKEVLAGMPALEAPALATPAVSSSHEADVPDSIEDDADLDVPDVQDAPDTEVLTVQAEEEPPMRSVEEGPVHRPLIRAQLPKIEGQKELRQAPDFTMRQPIGRGHFRGGGGMKPRGGGQGGPSNGNGNRPHGGGGSRFAGPRPGGQGRGPGGAPGRGGAAGGGFRSGQPRQGGGGGRKRSR
jgi:hypothetical protein